MEWNIHQSVTIYGMALWWSARLIDDVVLSTSPMEKPTHWEQIFLPVLIPINLKKDDVISLSLISDTRYEVKINLQWTVTHLRKGEIVSEQKMDMRKGWC
jgi:protein arginine N-methyltransferase 1